jgi:AcrR family transcriptional regulator
VTESVAATAVDPSAAPRRERGVRTRAGNAMERTRVAVLDGASRAVEKHGVRKATMGDIAMLAGIAKGTLYNHFRTKEAVFVAAIDAAITSLIEECRAVAREDLADALAIAAERVSGNPALRRVAAEEPIALAELSCIGSDGPWQTARAGVREVLNDGGAASDDAAVEVVLRWLVSFVASAGRDLERQAQLLVAGLAQAPARADMKDTSKSVEPDLLDRLQLALPTE